MIKSIITYLLMIGIPLLGLLWILDWGEGRLEAPPAIAGSWQIEGSLAECFAAPPSELAVQQSGRFLQVALGSASGDAKLDGHELRASVSDPEGPCGKVEVEGSFDLAAQRFAGRATGDCDACRDVYFAAQRAEKAKK
jgi:hypothetical protein